MQLIKAISMYNLARHILSSAYLAGPGTHSQVVKSIAAKLRSVLLLGFIGGLLAGYYLGAG